MNGPIPIADSVAKVRVPVMLLNGSKDARIAAAMPGIDSVMKALGKTYSAQNYEGAVHRFLRRTIRKRRPTRPRERRTSPRRRMDGRGRWRF